MASSSTAIGTVGLVAIQRQVRNLLSGINTERAVSEGRLIHELGEGGYVVVMAKASPPTVLPSESIAARGNPSLERQLDEYGQNTASAMGEALKRLEIPIWGDI